MPPCNRHQSRHWRALAALSVFSWAGLTAAQECDQTSIGATPLSDLGSGLYLGLFQGGLYPGGVNVMPAAHHVLAVERGELMQPLNAAGMPDPAGKVILLSIGMSNATQEFSRFKIEASDHPAVNVESLRIVDGAKSGETADRWDSPADLNYDRVRDEVLASIGLSEAQVQVAWVKVANRQPSASLPAFDADAYILQRQLGDIVRAMKTRYPNLRQVYLSSRIYAGYATTTLNPEPYAYESGFAVKWVVEAQIEQAAGGGANPIAGELDPATTPWIGWGPYLWADGLIPRSDGLTWQCTDLSVDGTHPTSPGRAKVADLMLSFFLTSSMSRTWFRAGPIGDTNLDGLVDVADLLELLASWGDCDPCIEDFDADGVVGVFDLLLLLGSWG